MKQWDIKKIEINKLDSNKKQTFESRAVTSVVVVFYYLLIVLLAILFDWSDVGNKIINLKLTSEQKGYIAFPYLVLIYVPYVFALYEINKLVFKTNKVTLALLIVSGSIFYFLPTSIFIIYKQFNIMNFSTFEISKEQIELKKLRLFNGTIFISMLINIIIVNSCLSFNKLTNAKNVISLNFLMFIVPFGFMSFALIGLIKSWVVLLYIILSVVCTDAFCYIFGLFFGKHKMAPNISPNKTWEGAILGSIFSLIAILVFLALLLFDNSKVLFNIVSIFKSDNILIVWIWIVCTTIAIIILSIIGDLTFSYFKRKFAIKDFGTILKSHGGILDRTDSILFASLSYIVILFIASTMVNGTLFT